MKPKKLEKKLTLKRETIVNIGDLKKGELDKIRGGWITSNISGADVCLCPMC